MTAMLQALPSTPVVAFDLCLKKKFNDSVSSLGTLSSFDDDDSDSDDEQSLSAVPQVSLTPVPARPQRSLPRRPNTCGTATMALDRTRRYGGLTRVNKPRPQLETSSRTNASASVRHLLATEGRGDLDSSNRQKSKDTSSRPRYGTEESLEGSMRWADCSRNNDMLLIPQRQKSGDSIDYIPKNFQDSSIGTQSTALSTLCKTAVGSVDDQSQEASKLDALSARLSALRKPSRKSQQDVKELRGPPQFGQRGSRSQRGKLPPRVNSHGRSAIPRRLPPRNALSLGASSNKRDFLVKPERVKSNEDLTTAASQ